jgi:hypothetical protein
VQVPVAVRTGVIVLGKRRFPPCSVTPNPELCRARESKTTFAFAFAVACSPQPTTKLWVPHISILRCGNVYPFPLLPLLVLPNHPPKITLSRPTAPGAPPFRALCDRVGYRLRKQTTALPNSPKIPCGSPWNLPNAPSTDSNAWGRRRPTPSSAKGAPYTSLGRSPRFRIPTSQRAESPTHPQAKPLTHPLQ